MQTLLSHPLQTVELAREAAQAILNEIYAIAMHPVLKEALENMMRKPQRGVYHFQTIANGIVCVSVKSTHPRCETSRLEYVEPVGSAKPVCKGRFRGV